MNSRSLSSSGEEQSFLYNIPAQFRDIPWQTAAKYLAIGTTAAGATYFIVKKLRVAEKPEKMILSKDPLRLPQPIIGPPGSVATSQAVQTETSADSIPTVSQLSIYPIKSCRGILVNSYHCGETGPELHTEFGIVRDRTWMVTTSKYVFITQRKRPKMSLIIPSINGSKLQINAPGMRTLQVALCPCPTDGNPIETEVWGAKIAALDLGDEAGAWFAEYLNLPGARFIFHPQEFGGRDLTEGNPADLDLWKKGDKCAFADGAPYLLLSEESVAEFSTHLEEPVSWNNFRPNILVAGCTPYAEDAWRTFSIGEAQFRNAKLCTRCTMTTVDPQKGDFSRKDVLQTLKKYRMNQSPEWQTVYENNPLISINLGLNKAGIVAVGDAVRQTS
ncbi:putative Mitochondrial amidoxime reducing component 2 [Hypsibius exemplaris]|uniref:Mitochondrial amidoxime reducing component 2 n=1 Tax=Hypsibius exemplaris TaxID=2072580 RepID=A0A1W0X5K8_HYPEX|nr:putative Mitochondrial amidoxime reducing component 2 [Hypsibius exemplaris]